MEVTRPGTESKPQLQPTQQLWQSDPYPTAGLHSDLSCCCWILNLLCHSRNSGVRNLYVAKYLIILFVFLSARVVFLLEESLL